MSLGDRFAINRFRRIKDYADIADEKGSGQLLFN